MIEINACGVSEKWAGWGLRLPDSHDESIITINLIRLAEHVESFITETAYWNVAWILGDYRLAEYYRLLAYPSVR